MKNKILIGGSLANCGGDISTEDLLRFLKSETEDSVDYYQLQYIPGSRAAVDWQAVLDVTTPAVKMATVLWTAYEKFIKPLCKNKKTNAFLFLTMRDGKKSSVQFSVGTDFTDKGEFVRKFSETIEKKRVSPDGSTEVEVREIQFSDQWKKVEK